MLQNFVFIYFTLGAILLIFYTPALFSKGLLQLAYGELSRSEKITCWIPVVNTAKAETSYTGKTSILAIANFFLLFVTIVRVITATVLVEEYVMQVITIYLFLFAILTYLLANMYVIAVILFDAKCTTITTTIVLSILFPIGQYYIGTFLNNVLEHVGKEDDTF